MNLAWGLLLCARRSSILYSAALFCILPKLHLECVMYACKVGKNMHYKSNGFSLIRYNIFQPTVSNSEEQEKLMSYLADLTGDEAKHLLSTVIHRNIDMRVEGLENDRQMREVDSNNDYLQKVFRRQTYKLRISENDYQLKLRREKTSYANKLYQYIKDNEKYNEKLQHELKEALEKGDKYKRFWAYCQSNHKEDKHHHRSETPKSSRNEKESDRRVKVEDKKLKIKPPKPTAIITPNSYTSED